MAAVSNPTDDGLRGRPVKRILQEWGAALRAAPLGEPLLLVALAILTGAVGGLGAILFRLMIRASQWFFVNVIVGKGLAFTGPLHPFLVAITPALGLLVVNLISQTVAREVKGHGVPQILESLALRRGRIRPRVGFFGILAPAITIGSQASVGQEGPIALIGASFGSSLGQVLRLSDQYTSLLLACGAAAGIGATFSAPIGGALFALEVVLGSYAMGALVPVFVASVTGTAVFGAIWGDGPVLPAPAYHFLHPFGVAFMLLLGLLGGGMGLAYTRGLYVVEDLFDGWSVPWAWKAIAGGLLVGLIGLLLPGVLGVGYPSVALAVTGRIGLLLLLALLIGKYLATLLTIGAGGSGGVFAPSLFLGAMLGGAFGSIVHPLFPTVTSSVGLYAVAGMGAVFAGAAQAPLTAIVIILEMTGDYHLTGGVIGACAISYLVYGSLARDSMYTVKLSRNGVRILRGAEVRPLQRVPVTAAMQPIRILLHEHDSVASARAVMTREQARALPVFRADDSLLGIVDDLRLLQAVDDGLQRIVGEVCRTGVPVIPPTLSLDDAMRRFGILTTDLLPVGTDAAHVMGTVTHGDVLRAYYNRTVLSLETRGKVELLRDRDAAGDQGSFREVALPAGWPAEGRPIGGLDLAPGVVVVSVRRGGETVVPLGHTVLRPGDRVLIYAAQPGVLNQAERDLLEARPRRRGLFDYLRLPEDWAPKSASLQKLHLPAGAILVAVQRGDRVVIPHGDTVLQPRDTVTLCAEDAESLAEARRALLNAGMAVR